MAAAPIFVSVTKESAVKVATNVTTGWIRMVQRGGPNAQWFFTYVLTGAGAPVEADFKGGRIFNGTDVEPISNSVGIDVYVWLRGDQNGEVRLDT